MECDICAELMDTMNRRPKMLPCGHTFCLLCLLALKKNECAVDRKPFFGAALDLPDNYAVLRMSERHLTTAPARFWCRDCHKEAAEQCADEHEVCSLKRVREQGLTRASPGLNALQRGEATLRTVGRLVSGLTNDVNQALIGCTNTLTVGCQALATKRASLQAAVDACSADLETAVAEAVKPNALVKNADHLLSALNDPTQGCRVTLRSATSDVQLTGTLDLKDAVLKLLLGRLLCAGKLVAEQKPVLISAVQSGTVWQERSNADATPPLSYEEMVAGIKVGSRVAPGKDWASLGRPGVPPAEGTVTGIHEDVVFVRWNSDSSTLAQGYKMGAASFNYLQLLVPTLPKIWRGKDPGVIDMEVSNDFELKTKAAYVRDGVRAMVGLDCQSFPTWSVVFLRKVSANVEVLGLVSPADCHLDLVRVMPRLRELYVSLPRATQHQLYQVLHELPELRRLEVLGSFEAPLPALTNLSRTVGLQWLRIGVYPLRTALALVRANAASLQELELVAASSKPYGCPDLAGELQRCGAKNLRRLLLLRRSNVSHCRHDAGTCRTQKASVFAALKCPVLCSACDEK